MPSVGRFRHGLAALLLLVSATHAQQVDAALDAQLRALIDPVDAPSNIEVSVRIEELDGDLVFDYDGDASRVLASNNKLLTTAAALLALPADFRWTTTCHLLEDGRLRIVGGGDPSLRRLGERDVAAEFLDRLAAKLKEAGVTRLRGIEIDFSCFDDQVRHPLWPQDQLRATYCAPVSGFSLNGGCLEVEYSRGGLTVYPPLEGVRWSYGEDRRWLSVFQPGDALKFTVGRPKDGRRQTVELAALDPEPVAYAWLQKGLRSRGIEVQEVRASSAVSEAALAAGRSEAEAGGKPLLEWSSAWTLAEVVVACNKVSDNYLAEVLLKTLGRERLGHGSFEAGCTAVQEILKEAGFEDLAFSQGDGSGMARSLEEPVNLASPDGLCTLLQGMAEREQGQLFFDSLPIGGVDSRIGKRFKKSIFHPQRIHAKTGYISYASSLSGYALHPEDEILAFSIVINFQARKGVDTANRRFKQLQEDILEAVLKGER